MRFLRPLEGLLGMFQCLPGKLVSCQVIFFPVTRGGSAVRVRSKFVKIGSSLVRVVWHEGSPSRWRTYSKALPSLTLFLFRHHRWGKFAASKRPDCLGGSDSR